MKNNRVKILSDSVANMIAAGEVVDRPASVVKELVENALDAGAKSVSVAVEGAGRTRIVVEDDGAGMTPEDALLSLKRHATSKIADAADLDRIVTLGFRGEALPSIASVSRFSLTTRTEGETEALNLACEGGGEVVTSSAAGATGTRVEVADLFFNTPARRKFLKSDATEIKNIAEVVARLALIHPATGFELKSDGRTLLALPPGQTLRQRAEEAAFVGSGLYWFERGDGARKITLAFAAPHEGKGRRDALRLFVNRRAVTDRILFAAVMEGYRGLLAEGRYPVMLLWLTVDPAEIDVNVHPAKREVRFADEGAIFRWVSSSVSAALAEAPWAKTGGGETDFRALSYSSPETASASRVAEALSDYGKKAASQQGFGYQSASRGYGYGGQVSSRYGSGASAFGRSGAPARPAGEGEVAPDAVAAGVFGELRYLGVVDATYLIFEDAVAGGMVLFDQHAAHERILYEQILKASREKVYAQKLLVPVVVECGAAQAALLPERSALLARLGFSTEPFGGRAISVTSAPRGLSGEAVEAVVEDFLGSELVDEAGSLKSIEEKLAARAACAAAVKAGKALHETEALALIGRLGALDNPTHCPHGRPLLVRLSRERVESLFHRR